MKSDVMVFLGHRGSGRCMRSGLGACVSSGGELKVVRCRYITRDTLGPTQHFGDVP